jgi:NADH-quinone oxidoreductase chain I
MKKSIIGIIHIAKGMLTVGKHAFRKPITLQYPEEQPVQTSRFKGRLALLLDAEGVELCNGCKSCSRVCPCGDLIYIETVKGEGRNFASVYTIDIGRCIFCGNCVEVCPRNALVMTKRFELAEFSKEALVCDKKMLTLSLEESNTIRDQAEKTKEEPKVVKPLPNADTRPAASNPITESPVQ